MDCRIATICDFPIIACRDLAGQPITPQELLDCLLLTAANDKKNAPQLKQAIEAIALYRPDTADICMQTLDELRLLPEDLRGDPRLLFDCFDCFDRNDWILEMTLACQALRTIASKNPAQAKHLNSATKILGKWWQPFDYGN